MTAPWAMLAATLVLLAGVFVLDRQVSRRRARRLRRLAERFGFRYSVADRFRLGRRVASVMPSADVTVRDLMYRSDDGRYTYAFTAVCGDNPRGVVVRATEGRGRSTEQLGDIRVADAGLPLGEQYRRLISTEGSTDGSPVEAVPIDSDYRT